MLCTVMSGQDVGKRIIWHRACHIRERTKKKKKKSRTTSCIDPTWLQTVSLVGCLEERSGVEHTSVNRYSVPMPVHIGGADEEGNLPGCKGLNLQEIDNL